MVRAPSYLSISGSFNIRKHVAICGRGMALLLKKNWWWSFGSNEKLQDVSEVIAP